MHSIFTQNFFFPGGGMPLDPLSYNMSDVNPHLTQCEPPPYIKAGSAPGKHGYNLICVSLIDKVWAELCATQVLLLIMF